MTRMSIITVLCTLVLSMSPLAGSTPIANTPSWYRRLAAKPFHVAPENATRDVWWTNVNGFHFDGHNPGGVSLRRAEVSYPVDFSESAAQRRAKILKRGTAINQRTKDESARKPVAVNRLPQSLKPIAAETTSLKTSVTQPSVTQPSQPKPFGVQPNKKTPFAASNVVEPAQIYLRK